MNQSKREHPKSRLFLGVDGGQSHTEAAVADENGNILGRGFGGASNHAEVPGGRERLQKAILESVGEALKNANLPLISEIIFASAHCGMTGGADYKQEIIGGIIKAEKLIVGHDAPTALFGATSGKTGIVVIAGTGAAIFGVNERNETARAGGLGFLFSDEGSGFWLATQIIRLAIKEQDGILAADNLQKLVLDYFGGETIRQLTTAFYNAKVSRDEIAGFAQTAQESALAGNKTIEDQIRCGCEMLVAGVKAVSKKLNFTGEFPVAGVGGMFRGQLMKKFFQEFLVAELPQAKFVEPRFGPAVGALLLAYRQADIEPADDLLINLENSS